MRIAVIAANGRSGRAFVNLALAAGHEIRAGVRSSSSLPIHPNLNVIQCDATNEQELRELIDGQEAVVSLIGHVKGSPPDVQTNAIQKAAAIMKAKGIKRLVSLTGSGVRFPGDKITLTDRFLNLGISIIDPNRVKDGRNHVEVLKNSGLDWTVIRVLKLQDVQPKPYRLSEHGPTKKFVGREEVAQAILEVLDKNSFVQKAPIISPA
ncbi:MAG TPA: NAD(P)H-binding protein [Candidatus Saccharimonadales bacterium]